MKIWFLGKYSQFLQVVEMAAKKVDRKPKNALNKLVTREYTIHLHKYIHGMWVLNLSFFAFRLSVVR